MHGIPDRARGKLLRSDSKLALVIWHPLVDHCADVSATMGALLRQPLISRRLCSLGGLHHLDDRIIQRLGAIAFLHDIGKAEPRLPEQASAAAWHSHGAGIEIAGHVRELYPLLCDESEVELLIAALRHASDSQSLRVGRKRCGPAAAGGCRV